MSSNSSAAMRAARLIGVEEGAPKTGEDTIPARAGTAALRGEEAVEVHEHPGRRSPDVVLPVRHRVVPPAFAFLEHAVAHVVRRIEQERERNLEDLGDLERIRAQVEG